jgi:RND superfamily putative drug exporter
MVTVFGAFVMEDAVFLKLAGIGLATAVFVDATLVRLVLVPATMELLGDRNWWLPRWLDRLLPHVDVEGEPAIPVPASVATDSDRDSVLVP